MLGTQLEVATSTQQVKIKDVGGSAPPALEN